MGKKLFTHKWLLLSGLLMFAAAVLGAGGGVAMAMAVDVNVDDDGKPTVQTEESLREGATPDHMGLETQLPGKAATATDVRDAGFEAEDLDPRVVNFRPFQFSAEWYFANKCRQVKVNSYVVSHARSGATVLEDTLTVEQTGITAKAFTVPCAKFENEAASLTECAEVFVEGVGGVTSKIEARATYFHERQHILNRLDGTLVRAILGRYGADKSALYGALEKLIGPNAASIYKGYDAVVLADEVSAFTMERVNIDEEWEDYLAKAGLDKEYIETIKNYLNGKDSNNFIEGRQQRPSYDDGSERRDGSTDGTNSTGASGDEHNAGVQPRNGADGKGNGTNGEHTVSKENSEVINPSYLDPRKMSDEEKQMRGTLLLNANQITVEENSIVATEEMSARKVAEKWWDENNPEPLYYETEVGEVEINKNSIKDSLAHRYSQAKLDAITGLADGFENAVYLGTMPDSRERGVLDHYFAFPIIYKNEVCYVFCRALQDANVNRLYVHEVFVADKIKKGDTLQTAASKPHGGISLYKDILANVLDLSFDSEGHLTETPIEERPDLVPTSDKYSSTDKGSETSEETKTLEGKIAEEESKVDTNPSEAQKEINSTSVAPKSQKKLDLFAFVDPRVGKPAFMGVYHGDGMQVATNGAVLVAIEREYPAELEGKIVDKKGNAVEGKFPDYKFLLNDPQIKAEKCDIDLKELEAFIKKVKADIKSKYPDDRGYMEEQAIRLTREGGRKVVFKITTLERFVKAARSIGGQLEIVDRGNIDGYGIRIRNGKDFAIAVYYKKEDGYDFKEEGRVSKDAQGNPLNEDGTLKIDVIKSIDELTDADFAAPTRNVQLPELSRKVNDAIGADGKPVIIKKNIFEKNALNHKFSAEESRSILTKALYNPDLVGKSQPRSKKNNWVVIKTDEKSPVTVLEVNDNKDNVEVVGWFTLDERNLERIKRQAEREGGELLILTPKEGAAASLSTLPSDLSSKGKGSNQSSEKQANTASEKIEDVGEKIGGARKDLAMERIELYKRMSQE